MSSGFIKIGELSTLSFDNIENPISVLSDQAIEDRFKKFAKDLKRIAPKADDFLYFSAIMITSAEASTLNADGSVKKDRHGNHVTASWDVDKNGSWRWVCSDANIRPLKNNNGDIFPELEILKAYKNWIGKPLCVDHKSSSVDAIRGVILDTYYDRKHKRVVGLCALDKVSYPELARGVQTGYKTCVSMGTQVATAICTDCGTVARAEQDFCNHMRTKSGYGEINVGLQPIELSIVVTGADPQAKIRTIIAAANTINSRVSEKEQEILKLSESNQFNGLPTDKLEELSEALTQLKELSNTFSIKANELNEEDVTNTNLPYGHTSGQLNPPSDDIDTSQGLSYPTINASDNAFESIYMDELKKVHASIENKLSFLQDTITKLSNKQEELIMAKDSMNKEGYWQGGGGVNEPTPGKVKYPIDPTNDKLRLHGDKQMLGEPPFPGVGDVDGLHPSPSSVMPKDELERKKLIQRAERRATALKNAKETIMNQKSAYWQGGGGVNEPTPGKVKYPVDPLNVKDRDKEDKQMVGQKPFPGVGDVDGLHPSPLSVPEKDELKRKEMLQRASLRAKFIRAANSDGSDNLGGSAWQVFTKDDGKLVFAASVDEISGNRSSALFDVIATKEFGTKLVNTIKSEGVAKAASVYKKAQAVAEPGNQMGAPADAGGAAPMAPEMNAPATDVKDEGGEGDPKETALKLSEEVRDTASDLLEAVRSLTGEQSQMGEMEQGLDALPKAASSVLAPMYQMRRNLNASLIASMKESLAALKLHAEDLGLVSEVLSGNSILSPQDTATIVNDSLTEAKEALEVAAVHVKSYAKYARGTQGILKKAEEAFEKALITNAQDMMMPEMNNAHDHAQHPHDHEEPVYLDLANDPDEDAILDEEEDLDTKDTEKDDMEEISLDDLDGMGDMNDADGTMVELPAGAPMPPGAKPAAPVAGQKQASFDLSTKAGRSLYRAKLAADATGKEDSGEIQSAESIKYIPELADANRLADGQTKLDVKPSDNLGRVETPAEKQKAMLDVARAEPKLRSDAARLNQYILKGAVKVEDLDSLVAQGLDAEVVKYWKDFYGEAGKEGSEFARLLTTEKMTAKANEEMSSYKVKIARAYELANDMAKRGLVHDDRSSISAYVDTVMTWNDEAFESMKRVVAKSPLAGMTKTSKVPQVGLYAEHAASEPANVDFAAELDAAFSGKKY